MYGRVFWLACCVAGLALGGCDASTSSSGGSGGAGGSGGSGGMGGNGGSGGETRLVVTADWLSRSLTLLDYDKLVDGQSDGPSAVVDTIDLSDWEPGPIEVEVTPDGKTAVVSVGPAFFDSGVTNMLIGSPEVPPGGTLLVVDLESGDATEIEISDVPLGIAISPDGTRAYTANYGTQDESGSTMSVIDLTTLEVIEEIRFGGRPEQVALSPDGTLGVINVAGGSGGVHVFETADVEGTMSSLVPTGNDPSDVTFFGDNTRVAVANSFGLDVALVDTSDRHHRHRRRHADPVRPREAPGGRLPARLGCRQYGQLRLRSPHRGQEALDHRPRYRCDARGDLARRRRALVRRGPALNARSRLRRCFRWWRKMGRSGSRCLY
ncbi:MAG: YncE family protein [Deltaproteobacteria bacterium]|nr:YncE family protein [Deltaproteobacteria bacterium]